jgi:hypothetical protein
MGFVIGEKYSRRQISRVLGGDVVSYLPTSGGRVVCACLKKSPRKNPGAPEEVTIGTKARTLAAAKLVYEQQEQIPIFIYREDGAWEYFGDYVCIGFSQEKSILHAKMNENPARGQIGGVLYFAPANTDRASSGQGSRRLKESEQHSRAER